MSVVRQPKVFFSCHSCGKCDLIAPHFYVARRAFLWMRDVPPYVTYCSLTCVGHSQLGATAMYRGANWSLDPSPMMLSMIASENGENPREIQTLPT